MPGGFPGETVDLLSVLCKNEKSNGRTETETMIATEETATFYCPHCGRESEVFGWVVIETGVPVFKTAPGLRPRCIDSIFTELIISQEIELRYAGALV